MILGLVLAMASSTPSPPPLKTITTVWSTPMCSALRTKVGPAIAAILQNDANIDAAKPVFGQIYHDDVIVKSRARLDMDLLHLENLIPSIVNNISLAQTLLNDKDVTALQDASDQRYIGALRQQLEDLLKKQEAALNVISGFFDTEQMGEVQTTSVDNPAWESVFVAAAHSNAARAPSNLSYGANAMLRAGLHHDRAEGYMPEFSPTNPGLGFDPYKPFSDGIAAIRKQEEPIEDRAAADVNAATEVCRSQSTRH